MRRKFLIASFVVFYIFSNPFIQDEVNRLWEPRISQYPPALKYELAIVLGGYSKNAPAAGQINFSEASDRIWTALELYHDKKIKKILLSGGNGGFLDDTEGEASYVAKHLIHLGVNRKDIIVEPRSKNTYQNAVESKKLIDSLGISTPILLITSTTHMPRSQACFNKLGLDITPFCVDGITGDRVYYFDHLFIPNILVLNKWNVIIHEWIGMFVYKLIGYT